MKIAFKYLNPPPLITITVVGLLFTIPAFYNEFFSGHDALRHTIWSKNFANQLWSGDLYPRWLIGMNAGLGSPVFFFYFPVPYYFTSLFHIPIIEHDSSGYLQLGLSSATALIISGAAAYLWLRTMVGPRPALIAALLYMLSPYHLLIDLYYRFAFTEYWAFAWMPLTLYFTNSIIESKRFGVTGYAISYSLLIMTHLPTALIFSIIPITYSLFLSPRKSIIQNSARVALGKIIGIGLASVYLIPALTMQEYVNFQSMTAGIFNFKTNFLFSSINQQPQHLGPYLFFMTITSMAYLTVCLFSNLATRTGSKTKTFWTIVAIAATIMMTEISSYIWEAIPLLQRIQFPYRFNTILTLSTTALIALFVENYKMSSKLRRNIAIVAISSFSVCYITVTAKTVYQRSIKDWGPKTKQSIALTLQTSPGVTEYIPIWTKEASKGNVAPELVPGYFNLEKPNEKIKATVWEPRRLRLQTEAEERFLLVLGQQYFPGWVAKIDSDNNRRIDVVPSKSNGLISLEIPEGTHSIDIALNPTHRETIGKLISLSSLTLLILSNLVHVRLFKTSTIKAFK